MATLPSASVSPQEALTELPVEALEALKTILSTAKAAVDSLKLVKAAISMAITAQLAPMLLLKGVLESALAQVEGGLSVVPKDILLKSNDLGKLNMEVEHTIKQQTESIHNVLFDIGRLSATQAGIDMEVTQLTDRSTFIDKMLVSVDLALAKNV